MAIPRKFQFPRFDVFAEPVVEAFVVKPGVDTTLTLLDAASADYPIDAQTRHLKYDQAGLRIGDRDFELPFKRIIGLGLLLGATIGITILIVARFLLS